MYRAFFKRLVDIVFSAIVLALLSPLLLLISLLILVFDFGPVIFVQQRVGRGGAVFSFFKFRSMPVGTGDIPSDKIGSLKIGWVGRFIRRTNLDELPQLWNIIRGDMSIVGPRPSLPSQTALNDLRMANGALGCRPGLTGLAQIRSFNGMSIERKAQFDAEYAADITFFGDTKIVLGTLRYLAKPPPVY
jgi:O-antigen biosynthesis protein WbqP